MNFANALKKELEDVPELIGKAFPIIASKDIKGPFVVYRRLSLENIKTLSGTSDKVEASYALAVLTENYSQLHPLVNDVAIKLNSFLGRNIGEDGPLVQNIDVEVNDDEYDLQIDKFKTNIQIQVKY